MKFSLPNNTDLIIGQTFLFTVTLKSDYFIDPNSTILFTKNKNITVPLGSIPLIPSSGGKTAIATVTLRVPNSTQENVSITFDVKTSASNFQSETLQYTAKTIDSQSLKLTADPEILDMPTSSNDPPTGSIFTKLYTTIQDLNGKTLSGVPVFITASRVGNLEKVHIFYTDDKKTRINIQHFGLHEGVFINSDKDGNIKFYIYPQESLPLTLQLFSLIPDSTPIVPAQTPIFIVTNEHVNTSNFMQMPEILNYWTGNLISNGSPNFHILIIPYANAAVGDKILFFVNNKYSNHFVTLKDPKKELDSYFIELPYYIFNYGELSKFHYSLIRQNGDMYTSESLNLTYMGGAIYRPDQSVERNYDACIVHTSLGINSDNIIPNSNDINYDSIMSYPGSKNKGLFIEILGGNNLIGKVPLDSDVTLKIYVSAKNKGFIDSFIGKMPAVVNTDTGLASLIIHIPYEDVVNIRPYDNGSSGDIYFDYEFLENDKIFYGKEWRGNIETIPE
ncbi:hypothetical protein [Xenorhabdus bovienii]